MRVWCGNTIHCPELACSSNYIHSSVRIYVCGYSIGWKYRVLSRMWFYYYLFNFFFNFQISPVTHRVVHIQMSMCMNVFLSVIYFLCSHVLLIIQIFIFWNSIFILEKMQKYAIFVYNIDMYVYIINFRKQYTNTNYWEK